MNKKELIEAIATETGLPKTHIANVLDSFTATTTKTLAEGEEVKLIGFGTFSVKERKERVGRNPQSGDKITIPAKRVPVFKPAKNLKETVGE